MVNELEIQEKIKDVIEEAIERKKIQKELDRVNKESNNVFLFREILGIRYIPTNEVLVPENKCPRPQRLRERDG